MDLDDCRRHLLVEVGPGSERLREGFGIRDEVGLTFRA